MRIPLAPISGKDYMSPRFALQAWHSNKPFKIFCAIHPYDGLIITKRDVEKHCPKCQWEIKFNKLSKTVSI